jgi:hypothetical protein
MMLCPINNSIGCIIIRKVFHRKLKVGCHNSPSKYKGHHMNNFKLDGRTIIIGIIIIAAVILLGPRLFNTNNTQVDLPTNQNPGSIGVDDNIEIGNVVTTSAVDMNGCATDSRADFEPGEEVYVVAENSDFPVGTSVFVRLYHEGSPLEDAPEIQADRDYTNSCVNFIFEPVSGQEFDLGSYQAEFIVNGNSADTVNFEVR